MVSQINNRLVRRGIVGDTIGKERAVKAVSEVPTSGITGTGASAGIASGRAKVVRSLAEMNKVEAGDVLVCEMMRPEWMTLLSKVRAIVADRGGILSNGAIIARERHVPYVTQTVVGTSLIRDGMLLTVDGSRGIVCVGEASKDGSRGLPVL